MVSRSTSKAFPGFKHLFYMSSSSSRQEFLLHLDEPYTDHEQEIKRGLMRPQGPVTAHWFLGGKKPRDVIWAPVGPALLTDRVVEALRNDGLTGWSTYPVDVYGPKKELVGRYHMLVIEGRSGPIDWRRSEVIQVQMPGGIFPHLKGMYFEETTWDGADFFWPENFGVVVTEDVVNTFKKLKALHIAFQPVTEFTRGWWPGDDELGLFKEGEERS